MDVKCVVAVLLCFAAAFAGFAASQDNPVVRTKLGEIKGSFMESRLGKRIYSFRGIRYAKPPTGQRRFKVRILKRFNFFIFFIFINKCLLLIEIRLF